MAKSYTTYLDQFRTGADRAEPHPTQPGSFRRLLTSPAG